MTTVDTEELSTVLRGATDGLEPRAGFTNAVLRGGRRRQLRHRIAVATSAAAAIAVATGGTYAVLNDNGTEQSQVAAGWLNEPTKGELAGDREFLDSAIAAWEAGKSRSPNAIAGIFDDLRSAPHVYWAGNTAAGRTAVVMQQAYLHPHENLPATAANTLQTLVGLVTTDDGQFKLVTDQFQWKSSDPAPGYFQFGLSDRTLLIVDRGTPLMVNTGKDKSVWEPMPIKDGVAIKQFEEDRAPFPATVVSGADPDADSAVQFPFLLASMYLSAVESGGTGLPRPPEELRVGQSGGPEFETADVFFNEVSVKLNDGNAVANYPSNWLIRAGLDDGRVAVVGHNQTGGTPSRIYAVLVNQDMSTQVLEGEVVGKSAVLPVKFRLPDAQGWVVFANGAELSYRTSQDGQWQDAGVGGALIPDNAVQVRVDGQVVDLPR